MNKYKALALSTLLISGIASAAPSCDGFQIKLKNNLADDLLVTKISLNGADIQPGGFEKLDANSEQVFTINQSNDNVPMNGEFTLRTLSLPSKTVKVRYSLENKTAFCEHTDNSPESDYTVEKTRSIGQVHYSITNK